MRHIIVAQGDARALTDMRAPLSVGIARWRSHGGPAAVVVKATLSYADGLDDTLARFVAATPVCGPQLSELDPAVLAYPDDFVVHKPRTDITIIGHAHCIEPSEQIALGVRIGDFDRTLLAVASGATRTIPLLGPHLREHGGHAPLPLHAIACRRENEDEGPGRFDFDRFQCAEANMRLRDFSPDASIMLTGLSPRAPHRTVRLPSMQPAVWFDSHPREHAPLHLRCDTLWIDTDYEKLVLVWRGLLPANVSADAVDRILVTLVQRESLVDEDAAWAAGMRTFARGDVSFALEEDPNRLPEPDVDDLTMARYELLEFAADPHLSMKQFAQVSTGLAEQQGPRDVLLADSDLDERTWLVEERAWTERIAEAQQSDDQTLVTELSGHLLHEQDELAGPLEPRSLLEYAMLRRSLDETEAPGDLLLSQNMGIGEWARLERHWLARAQREPAVGDELRALLTQAHETAGTS